LSGVTGGRQRFVCVMKARGETRGGKGTLRERNDAGRKKPGSDLLSKEKRNPVLP